MLALSGRLLPIMIVAVVSIHQRVAGEETLPLVSFSTAVCVVFSPCKRAYVTRTCLTMQNLSSLVLGDKRNGSARNDKQ